jgi:tRNA 2-selenouridine synthase
MLPKRLHAALQKETTLWLETQMHNRIRVIAEDYAVDDLPSEDFAGAIDALIPRLGHKKVSELHQLLARREWDRLIEALMREYYDPLYAHTKPEKRVDIEVDPFAAEHPELVQALNSVRAQHQVSC